MSLPIQNGLILGITRLFNTLPWIIAAAIAFYPERRQRKSVIIASSTVIGLFVFLANACLMLFKSSDSYYHSQQTITAVNYLLILFFFTLCYKLRPTQLLYVFCLLHAVSNLINQIAYITASAFAPPGIKVTMLTTPLYNILMNVLSIICSFFVYRFCKNSLREAFQDLDKKNTRRLCIVPIMFFVVFELTIAVCLEFNGSTSAVSMMLLLFAAGILTYVVNIQVVTGSAKSARLRTETEEAKKLLTVQQRSYAQLLDNIAQTKADRHDLRFHLSVIGEFATKGDTKALTDYLERFTAGFSDKALKFCDNAAADAIIRHFVQQIRAHGASCECTVVLPAKTGVDDVDLCVVLGNLLENALHSLDGQDNAGFLHLRCMEQEHRILITVDNSLPEGFTDFKKGIGLQSVYAVAERYNGSAKLESTNGIFKASVILHMLQ